MDSQKGQKVAYQWSQHHRTPAQGNEQVGRSLASAGRITRGTATLFFPRGTDCAVCWIITAFRGLSYRCHPL